MEMSSSPREVAESYIAAECSHDTDEILRHYHDDAVLRMPDQEVSGRDALRRFYDENAAGFPTLEIDVRTVTAEGEMVALEWDALMVDTEGRRYPLSGVNLSKVVDGRFEYVHSYYDLTPFGASDS